MERAVGELIRNDGTGCAARGRAGSQGWPHRLAAATACATFLLILAGGLVTNTGAGLAVPDWPTTFGENMFLFPWSRMVDGIVYEHGHRLLGAGVGLLTLALAVTLWVREPRRWMRRLGAAALAAVILQGLLGGLRVVLLQDHLAIFHGALAQGFFALTVGLAVLTSRDWTAPPERPLPPVPGHLRGLCLLTTGLIYLQIVFGALLTHLDTRFGIRLGAHLAAAGALCALVQVLAIRVLRRRSDYPGLVRPVIFLGGVLALQLLLGLGAYLGRFTGVALPLGQFSVLAFPVAHRLNGGLLLAISLVLVLRACRVRGTARPGLAVGLLSRRAAA